MTQLGRISMSDGFFIDVRTNELLKTSIVIQNEVIEMLSKHFSSKNTAGTQN